MTTSDSMTAHTASMDARTTPATMTGAASPTSARPLRSMKVTTGPWSERVQRANVLLRAYGRKY